MQPLCSGCGSAMQGDASKLSCNYCGLVDRNPTPPVPVEDLANLCRNTNCLHPMDPEHDDLGCHIPGCLCTDTFRAVEAPGDVMQNSGADKAALLDKIADLRKRAQSGEKGAGAEA